jgi:hypothetical protein
VTKRYELHQSQWERIEGLLPGKREDPGRSGRDNRLFVHGVSWVLLAFGKFILNRQPAPAFPTMSTIAGQAYPAWERARQHAALRGGGNEW